MDEHDPSAAPPPAPARDDSLPPEIAEIRALLGEAAEFLAELERRREERRASISASAST